MEILCYVFFLVSFLCTGNEICKKTDFYKMSAFLLLFYGKIVIMKQYDKCKENH